MSDLLRKLQLIDHYGMMTGFAFILTMAALMIGAFAIALSIDRYACGQYAEATGREVRYVLPNGCYVQHGEAFIPMSEYKARVITHADPTP